MSLRLGNIDNAITGQAQSKEPERGDDASNTSSGTVNPPHGHPKDVPEGLQRNHLSFAFEEDLFASRVYRKPLFGNSGDSLFTAAARTTAWSILSGISLTDVSNISVLAVPIYAHEISNSARYIFGDFQPESLTVKDREAASNDTRGGHALLLRGQGRAAESSTQRQPEPKVLGVPLEDLIEYCHVEISITNEKGEPYVEGYIPVIVANIGLFLRQNGQSMMNQGVYVVTNIVRPATEVENIFSISGSARRLHTMEAAFNEPLHYVRSWDWTDYTVHDAACILLRFLLRLPESVIPVDCYEAFHAPLDEEETAIHRYQRLITSLPPLSRHLLQYLLDLLAAFASKSEINKMTSQRLAAIFQPALLSPNKAGEEYIEESGSCRLSQMVLVFLIQNWDNLMLGMMDVF